MSDPLGITAQGLPTHERLSIDEALKHIAGLVEQHAIARVVVGDPIGHAGQQTAMSERARGFADKLRRRLPCPVELWDERLTSVIANRVLRESGMGMEKRRRAVDRVAATLLLQGYLDYHASERARTEVAPSGDNKARE